MNYLGQEQRIELNDKVYWLSRLERRIIRQWVRWARSKIKNPLDSAAEVLKLELSDDIKSEVVMEAERLSQETFEFLGAEMQFLFHSEEGQIEILVLLLLDANRTLLRSEAEEVAKTLNADEVLRIAQGVPYIDPGDVPDFTSAGPSSVEPIDWHGKDQKLIENFYLLPWELDRLTLTEMFSLYRQAEKEVSKEVAIYRANAYLRLTPEQKLVLAFRQMQ